MDSYKQHLTEAVDKRVDRSLMIVSDELARVILYGGNIDNGIRKVTKEMKTMANYPAEVEKDSSLLNKNFSRAVDAIYSGLRKAYS